MANAFSTQGATTNGNSLSLTGMTKSLVNNTTPKAKALDSFKFGSAVTQDQVKPQSTNNRVLNATSTSLTPNQSMQTKPVAPVAPVTPKITPTGTGMVNSGTSYQPTVNTSSNTGIVTPTPTTATTPTAPINPTPTHAGLVGNLANVANTPNAEFSRKSQEAEDAYKKSANFNRDVGKAQLDATTNPEYSIDTGVGLGNRIAQNTGLQMKALSDSAYGLQQGANSELTRQGLTQSGLTSAAGFTQPDQVPYSNQYINPLTGQPVGGGTSGSLTETVSKVAEKLGKGEMTYNDALNALSGYGQGGVNALQSALPQGFNIAQSNALGSVQGTVGPAYDYADTALKNVETLMSQLPDIQKTNIPLVNQITQGFSQKTGLGSEGTRAVTGGVNTLRNAYASLLASSKGGTPTDYSGQALAEIPDSPTPNDIAALRKNFETLGQARKKIYGNAGSSNTQSGGVTNSPIIKTSIGNIDPNF